MPGVTEDEAVRIFIEFDRIDSAIKGRFLQHLLTLYSIITPFDASGKSCVKVQDLSVHLLVAYVIATEYGI